MNKSMLFTGLALVLLGIAGLVAVGVFGSNLLAYYMTLPPDFTITNGPARTGTATRMMDADLIRNMMTDFSKSSYDSDGERIYLTATDKNGDPYYASFAAGKMPMSGMMSRSIACVNCHGLDGKGGYEFPDGSTSPDIRWSELEAEGFDSGLFKNAVTKGINEKDEALGVWMPRWDIDAAGLADLEDYLKTL